MIFAYCIAADLADPDPPSGMVRAPSIEAAFAALNHPDTNLYPLPDDVEWPGGECDIWVDR